ncbi:MAG: hypothetical protein N4A40_05115 [Tissierellales bacterium]|jgi:predicted amidohydrolase|nr:hypothetical protein [Tissierellales bacterium]
MKKQLNIGFAESLISRENPYLQYDELEKIILQNKALDLICFPELYLISDSKSKYINENILNDIFDRIDYLSNTYNIAISYGSILPENDKLFIAQIVSIPNKSRIVYKKTHLGKNELSTFSVGDQLFTFEYKSFTLGIQLCIETHIPELTTIQRLKGANIIIAPFNTPLSASKRIDLWKKYIPTRSYDNQCFFLCNNFYGGQLITSPSGKILFESCKSTTQSFTIEYQTLNSKTDFLKYRRPELYNNLL